MRIPVCIKSIGIAFALTAAAGSNQYIFPKTNVPDTFERQITPKGSSNELILSGAPSPVITIAGEKTTAAIVVDLNSNILYKYNSEGNPEAAFLIASGKKSTPTQKGVRIVTHIEKYPYKNAPASCKRRKNPNAYGPYIICLNKINPLNAEQSTTGQFIHGTNQPSKLGQYVSHGCMRMDNEVIKTLSQQVKRGDIVIIK